MPIVTGEFTVVMQAETLSALAADSGIGRMSLDKRYHGALQAEGKGEMLAHLDRALGSGAYVALERVSGTLDGRSGAFLLHHTGVMTRGAPGLTVAPDSGSGDLSGLRGTLQIRIEGGQHYYDLDYTL
jgi:hypothetical protein